MKIFTVTVEEGTLLVNGKSMSLDELIDELKSQDFGTFSDFIEVFECAETVTILVTDDGKVFARREW